MSKLEFHASFPWEISTRTEFWIKLLNIFSLTLANPFIDNEYFLVRLCSGKRVECKLHYFSINYLCDVFVVLEMSFPSFCGLVPLRCHRIMSQTQNRIWEDVNFCLVCFRQLVVDSINSLMNLVSWDFRRQYQSADGCAPLSSGKVFRYEESFSF